MDRRLLALLLLAVSPAGAQCRLCASSAQAPAQGAAARPLAIEIETALDLGRVAQTRGGGSVALDAVSGTRSVTGGLVDLGGMALRANVRITGEAGRHVRVQLPASIRLTAPDGGSAEVVDLRSDLGPDPVIGASGELSFGFGGRLIVDGPVSGELRGRIAVTADYW